MSYDNPAPQTLQFNGVNFGTTTTRTFRTPKGMRGRIRRAMLLVTTSFVGTTTPGRLQVGDGVTANKYLDMAVGAASAGTAAGAALTAASSFDGGLGIEAERTLPAKYLEPDTLYTVTFLAPTGGSPAGVGDASLAIDYF